MSVRRNSFRRAGTLALIGSGFFLLSVASANAQCVGDCDGNGTVAINELILGVNIALESQPVSACEVFACTDGTTVPINCLIQGVSNALAGCPSTTPGPTPTATPPVTDCPLEAGEYTIVSQTGGSLRVASLSPFPFPPGGMVVMDATAGNADCIHEVVVPADGGFSSPVFCIQALGFSVAVEQDGCGIGRIDSDGGSDVTVRELGDTSSSTCGTEETCSMVPNMQNSAVRVDVTVGDGTVDTCASANQGNAIVAIPVHTTTWLEGSSGSSCPATDGEYSGEGSGDTLITEFDQILDFTTDSTVTMWQDIDADGCFLNGSGPAGGFPASTGACLDVAGGTVTTVASGPVGSSGAPLFDLTFVTSLPNSFERSGDRTNATCAEPPVISFEGTATRCLQ